MLDWLKSLKIWLIRKRYNLLGLESRPVRPPNDASAAVKADYKKELAVWLCQCNYEAVQMIPEALDIVD